MVDAAQELLEHNVGPTMAENSSLPCRFFGRENSWSFTGRFLSGGFGIHHHLWIAEKLHTQSHSFWSWVSKTPVYGKVELISKLAKHFFSIWLNKQGNEKPPSSSCSSWGSRTFHGRCFLFFHHRRETGMVKLRQVTLVNLAVFKLPPWNS